jgi:formylglycine-generating enzyme required for sulfatase activity
MPLPDLPLWQVTHDYSPRAVSRKSVVPQGYLTYYLARGACEAAGKRLCTRQEWVRACKGEGRIKFPYGDVYQRGKCNVDRLMHPAVVLHGASWFGHTDPRLNLVVEQGTDPLLHVTGQSPECASRWGADRIYDMVGNLDEWVDDEKGIFLGGFYARSTKEGCESAVTNHAPVYYDYSIGTRCCASSGVAVQGQ